MRSFTEKIRGGKEQYGEKYSSDALARKFVPYYENQQRIKVMFPDGSTACGTVGATTGWIPCFLLIKRSTDLGSSTILSEVDRIVAVQVNGKYRPL